MSHITPSPTSELYH